MASDADAKLREANAKFEQLQREDEQRIRKEGWLQKQGGGKRRANWKKRYFVLQLSKLTYYVDAGKKTVKGTIDLMHDPTNRVAISDHKEHCFFITRDNARTFFITAPDDGQRNAWIKAIQECFQIKREQYDRQQKDAGSLARASVISSAPLALTDPYDPNVVRHEGWLEKKGGGKTRANWTKRWFVVRLRNISYFTDQKKSTLKGVIPLDDTITANPSAAKVFAIAISVPGRIFLVDAHSEPERNTWLAVINECKKLLEEQKRLKVSPTPPSSGPSMLPPPSLSLPPSSSSSSSSPSSSPSPAPAALPPPVSLGAHPPPVSLGAPRPPALIPPGGLPARPSSAAQRPEPPSAGPIEIIINTGAGAASSPRRPPLPSSNSSSSSSSSFSASQQPQQQQPQRGRASGGGDVKAAVGEMATDALCEWLGSIGVSADGVRAFEENQITGKDATELTEEELRVDLGLDAASVALLLETLGGGGARAVASPQSWSAERCIEWLQEIGCPLAIPIFEANQLTGLELFELTENEILAELDIPLDDDTPQRLWKNLNMLKLRHTPFVPGLDY